MTDGYIDASNGQIKLCLKHHDIEVLENIKRVMLFSGHVRSRKVKDGRLFSTLCICRKSMAEDLYALGMAKENKTFNTELPKVPEAMFWDLVRGIFEGDGSIRHRTGNTDALDITIAGATKQFMLDLQTALEKRGIFVRIYTRKAGSSGGNKHEMYTLNTKSNADALRLCYFMYANTTENIRLRRKFDIYANYVRTYYDKVKRRSIPCNELVELADKTIVECSIAS